MHRLKISYFDYAATTPTDDRVVKEMLPYFGPQGVFGNSSSAHHAYGTEAASAVEMARQRVARRIEAPAGGIIWTSGATEANNLAIRGYFKANTKKPCQLVTVATEHKTVLDTAKAMRDSGIKTTILPVDSNGLVDLEKLNQATSQGNTLVSVMWVNNETGVIQPVQEIAKLCKKNGAVFHIDAAQAVGKTPVSVKKVPADLVSLSAHKVYGPKGIGALYIRRGTIILPITTGGGQEKGLRPGTLPVPMIVGMGKAFDILQKEIPVLSKQATIWHNQIAATIEDLEGGKINGGKVRKVPHILNVSFKDLDAELIPAMRKIAVSNGSACTTQKTSVSHVLRSMGVSRSMALNSVRISMGRYSTEQDIKTLQRELIAAVKRLRAR